MIENRAGDKKTNQLARSLVRNKFFRQAETRRKKENRKLGHATAKQQYQKDQEKIEDFLLCTEKESKFGCSLAPLYLFHRETGMERGACAEPERDTHAGIKNPLRDENECPILVLY